MAKVVVAKFRAGKGKAVTKTAVVAKRVRDASGKFTTVRTIDGHSKSFANDLTYVFARNVAKARRENKAVTGVADRVPAKGRSARLPDRRWPERIGQEQCLSRCRS